MNNSATEQDQQAEQLGLTMFARCQGRHYLLYTGAHRLLDTQPAQA